jgi:murein peptide amidase A
VKSTAVLLAAAAAACSLAPAEAANATRHLIGRSLRGQPIYAYESGSPAGEKILVVGCIHGNETAGIAIARQLETMRPPPGVDLWIVPSLNPDGAAAGTRQNAHGVDLNRNFPWRWRDLEGVFESGPHALSEPESRAAYRLILRLRPSLSIWFHQHLGVVDDSQGSAALERRFARLTGLPSLPLLDLPGSVTNWENHVLPRSTAFVVELRAGVLTAAQARRDAKAVLAIG